MLAVSLSAHNQNSEKLQTHRDWFLINHVKRAWI